MARRSKNDITDIIILLWNFIVRFVRKAYNAGRLTELLISVPLLILVYYLMISIGLQIYTWYFLPISVFVGYWFYLFSHEKITSNKANLNWENRDWWWTLDGWEFEEEVAKIFRLNGYRAEVTRKTSDGGIDILMYKDRKKIIVQCKHYSQPVGVSVARELNGLKGDFKADELVLVASSGVTKSGREFIENKPYFKIFDLEDIIRTGLRPYSS